ncbi:MAG: response regulator transcription factor [Eubacteriaceae bacterium]|nr:response regulator transcription factor [Eubacteriaceae bacterium]
MVKILIVDDHEMMREAFSKTLSAIEGYEVVAEIANASYAYAYCERLSPDLVLMDICTEDGASGLDAAVDICQRLPHIKVILTTAFDEISYIPRAKEAGVHAFIYKSRSLAFFSEITQKVMNGESYFPEEKTIPFPKGEAPLTKREMEILRLLCKHMTKKEIGAELFISENTVKYHIANMLAKTGFPTAIDLAFHMISNGWINPKY